MDLFRELRPLYTSMALVGLFHEPEPPSNKTQNEQASSPTTLPPPPAPPSSVASSSQQRRRLGSRAYCWVVTLLLWFSFLRYTPSFWVGVGFNPSLLVDRVLHVTWFFNNALMAAIFLSHCRNPRQMTKLVTSWERFWAQYTHTFLDEKEEKRQDTKCQDLVLLQKPSHAREDSKETGKTFQFWSALKFRLSWKSVTSSSMENPKKTRVTSPSKENAKKTRMTWRSKEKPKKTFVMSSELRHIVLRNVIIAWCMILLNMGTVVVFVLGGLQATRDFGTVICNPFPDTLPVEAFFLAIHFLDTCAWILPTAFTCTWCSVLDLCFSRLTETLKTSVFHDETMVGSVSQGEAPQRSLFQHDDVIKRSVFHDETMKGSVGQRETPQRSLFQDDDFQKSVFQDNEHVKVEDGSFVIVDEINKVANAKESFSLGQRGTLSDRIGDGCFKSNHSNEMPLEKEINAANDSKFELMSKTGPHKRQLSSKQGLQGVSDDQHFAECPYQQDSLEVLESTRRLHLHLCACVSVLDRTLNRVVMATYITSVPQACFLLYMLVNTRPDVFTGCVLVFWTLCAVLVVTLVSVSCARVHEAAHSPLRYLYYVDVGKARTHQRDQLHLFVSKLTGPSIGFSALGIITVTKEMLLTVGGLLVTYFFLLLQFRI